MLEQLLRRGGVALVTIFIIISISFLFVRFMPGDPLVHLVGQEEYYYLLETAPEYLDDISEKYGLNDTLGVQYLKYLRSIAMLEFGHSYANHRPVLKNVITASKWTLLLSIPTLIISGILGGICGVIAGWNPGKLFDKISTPISLLVNTIPTNCMSLMLLILFAYRLRLFPINGMVSAGVTGSGRIMNILWHIILPLTVLIMSRSASNFMLMKSAVSQVRKEEYTLTAISKGLPSRVVLFRHVLRNAFLPYLTSMFLQIGGLLSGSMIVEVVFGWKGMGLLMYNAVQSRDFPTAQLCFLISAVMVVLSMLASDIINTVFDPRIREAVLYENQ